MMVLKAEEFSSILSNLKDKRDFFQQVIIPYKSINGPWVYRRLNNSMPAGRLDLNPYRTITPIKFLFYFPRESVYPVSNSFPKRLIAGLKACDLKALEILDAALMKGNFREPVYTEWRKNTTIISSDCAEITDTCCCNLFGGKPYPEKGFDVNVSRINGKILLTPGSEKGEELLQIISANAEVRESMPYDEEVMYRNRNFINSLLNDLNSGNNHDTHYSELRLRQKELWDKESSECVGCGACTNVCPTCYCLILNDESKENKFVKMRTYDSCQWFGYARVAGGGTPRPAMHARFRNRYLCKLDYMKSNFGMAGCTGCGRCSEVCTAGIDFKKVIHDLCSTPPNEVKTAGVKNE